MKRSIPAFLAVAMAAPGVAQDVYDPALNCAEMPSSNFAAAWYGSQMHAAMTDPETVPITGPKARSRSYDYFMWTFWSALEAHTQPTVQTWVAAYTPQKTETKTMSDFLNAVSDAFMQAVKINGKSSGTNSLDFYGANAMLVITQASMGGELVYTPENLDAVPLQKRETFTHMLDGTNVNGFNMAIRFDRLGVWENDVVIGSNLGIYADGGIQMDTPWKVVLGTDVSGGVPFDRQRYGASVAGLVCNRF